MISSFVNDVQICDVTTLMGLKVEMKFGTFQKKFKIPSDIQFFINHAKSNFFNFLAGFLKGNCFGLIFKRKCDFFRSNILPCI